MKEITPYTTTQNAIASLDNGGRFYNLATTAKDGIVTSAELAKAAGVFSDKQNMILYLEMALVCLDENQKNQIITSLSHDLKSTYQKHLPQHLLPSEARNKGVMGGSVIITGIPKFVDSKTQFSGFIMIPIIAGKVTTFTFIPIMDQYDVYEIRDHASDEKFFIAHARGKNKLPDQTIRCGGILKELKSDAKDESSTDMFLEAVYYSTV